MRFKKKRNVVFGNQAKYNGEWDKPTICPYCGISTDAIIRSYIEMPFENGKKAVAIPLQCTDCGKTFIGVYIKAGDILAFNTIIPITEEEKIHEGIKLISPRFAELHRQAFRAESRSDFNIAIMGYRAALEILLKDYLVNVDGVPLDDIKNKKLAQTIQDYTTDEMLNSADVVRLVGNSESHYIQEYEDFPFEQFKVYYNGFVKFVEFHYDMKNPPVKR